MPDQDSQLPALAVLFDMVEEGWSSMDYVGESIAEAVSLSGAFELLTVCPPMVRRFGARSSHGFSADRLLNRFHDYPRVLRKVRRSADLFHIVDHSYGQLIHALPGERTVVTCHDVDTFRCLIEPQAEHRSFAFRAVTRRVLSGLRRAAVVCCDSAATQRDLDRYGLVDKARTCVVPLPVHRDFTDLPSSDADLRAAGMLRGAGPLDLVHVGSTAPRKRIDHLLRLLAAVRAREPRTRLVRVGGAFTSQQDALARDLGVRESVLVLPFVPRPVLAAIYRRATVVLLTSEREGFGLAPVEALACGAPVVASDLPVLREVAGDAVSFAPVGDVPAWVQAISDVLDRSVTGEDHRAKRRRIGLGRAAQLSLTNFSSQLVAIYRGLLRSADRR